MNKYFSFVTIFSEDIKRLGAHRKTEIVELLKARGTCEGNPEPSPEAFPGRWRD
jgi:hypothetical protein